MQRPESLGLLIYASVLAACFEPTPGATTDSTGDETDGNSDPTTTMNPTESVSETTPSATLPTTSLTTSETTADTESTGTPPECEMDSDCTAAGECEIDVCDDAGMCAIEPARAGTACGDDASNECTEPDTCDGAGACVANDVEEGSDCTSCELGVCTCAAGACSDCVFAPENNFITTRSIDGWELTGGWALYRVAPQSYEEGVVVFGDQVLGTDGNRTQPYPGSELEESYARSGPFVIPETLDFLSWHVDEGGDVYDSKAIAISIDDGDTWTLVADCFIDNTQPFCGYVESRAPDAWDQVSLDVPANLQGELGIVELRYATGDGCCGFEHGWYVDVTNFATECGCIADPECEALGGECGAALCGATGECGLDPEDAGTACGDDSDVDCDNPDLCDGVGYCLTNEEPTGLTLCNDCPAGPGACQTCREAACNDCTSLATVSDFENGSVTITGWVAESIDGTASDWRLYSSAPPDTQVPSSFISFSTGLVFGTDGNRATPYDTAVAPFNAHTENSRVTTTPDLVPSAITFNSWHVDEGNGVDNKTIELSTDGGATWNILVDCNQAAAQALYPFCVYRDDDRPGNVFDAISVDSSAFAGETGMLRFTYSTLDSCCNFERGWYIDNLAFAQYCTDPQFP